MRATSPGRPRGGLDAGHRGESMSVALVVPLHGPAGMFGPSCELCATLAVEELNATEGLLGREVRLTVVDGGAPPARVADEVDRLIRLGAVHAVTGWHTSAVRQAVAPRIAQRVPYVYTALYEGGEATPGVFLTGETPQRQVLSALRWMSRELRVRRWAVVGNDYVWPRRTAATARAHAGAYGVEICAEIFVGLGTTDFQAVLSRLERSVCDGVLMLLVGEDGVHFNRQFASARLDQRCVRLSPLMDENMILATGAGSTAGVYSTAGYFEALPTAESLDFSARFARRFGPQAPVLNSLGESCYEGVLLLATLLRRAGSPDLARVRAAAPGTRYAGPRGEVHLWARHVQQQVYLARATALDLDVVTAL